MDEEEKELITGSETQETLGPYKRYRDIVALLREYGRPYGSYDAERLIYPDDLICENDFRLAGKLVGINFSSNEELRSWLVSQKRKAPVPYVFLKKGAWKHGDSGILSSVDFYDKGSSSVYEVYDRKGRLFVEMHPQARKNLGYDISTLTRDPKISGGRFYPDPGELTRQEREWLAKQEAPVLFAHDLYPEAKQKGPLIKQYNTDNGRRTMLFYTFNQETGEVQLAYEREHGELGGISEPYFVDCKNTQERFKVTPGVVNWDEVTTNLFYPYRLITPLGVERQPYVF